MKAIVGDQMLRLALTKLQSQVGREDDFLQTNIDVKVMLRTIHFLADKTQPRTFWAATLCKDANC